MRRSAAERRIIAADDLLKNIDLAIADLPAFPF
jgi:hypothetical protein